jgi:hypothetical protein
MSRRRLTILGVFLAAAALAAGCGGGGGGAVPATGGGKAQGAGTSLKVKLVIPSSASTSAHRRPAYVSASTQSAVVRIFSGTSTIVNTGNDYFNLTSSDCTTTSSGMTCSFSVPASISASGSYQVVIATFDAPQTANCTPLATPACAGNVLSLSDLTESITVGSATPLNVTMGGVPAYLQPLGFVSGEVGGESGSHNTLNVYGPGAKTLQFELLDADRNVIIGGGVPVISATGGPALAAAVTQPTAESGVYTLTLTPTTTSSSVGPVVEPTLVPIDVSGTVPNGSAGFSVTALINVFVRHSAIYVAHYTSTTSGVLTVDAYLDGNTTAYSTGYSSGTGYLGVATDVNGNIWIADAYNNAMIEYLALDPSVTPSEAATITGGQLEVPNPANLTFDAQGNVYVAFCGICYDNTPSYTFAQYSAPLPTSSPDFSSSFTFASGTLVEVGALAVDASYSPSPHIYAGVTSGASSNVSVFTSGSMSSIVVPFAIASPAAALAVEPTNGYLWVLEPGVSTATATEINPSTGTVLNTIGGLPLETTGMSVDYFGNVYFAEGAPTTGVVEYSPPSFSSPTTIGTAVYPVNVTVVPNALFALNNPPGMQTPLPSAFPLPTP